MPALRQTNPRRVGLVARTRAPSEEQDRAGPEARDVDVLLTLVDSLVRALRAGEHTPSPEEGVLLDVTIGRVRCLFLEQRESTAVSLSPREQQIALMVASGRTNQAIAGSLEISAWTVSTHLRRIYAKLAVSSRAEMVAHLLDHAEYSSLVDAGTDHRAH
ncbi:MAG: helix-turn-helix transcriptional regulator [Nocardioides sp.]